MTVVIAPSALAELAAIWDWNATMWGARRANGYLAFLRKAILGLSKAHLSGRRMEGRPDIYYVVAKRRPKGHGHIIVYSVEADSVTVLHVFHTAQDWESKL